jgi:hypothetical protein
MSDRFRLTRDGRISLQLHGAEAAFLSDMLEMLEGVGRVEGDPGEERLNVPAYLGDAEAADEWRQLMGGQIKDGRARDRQILLDVIAANGPVTLDFDQAEAILRVVNESRLVLAARLGVEVESDYEDLDVGETVALHFLGLLIEDLTELLSELL